MFFNKWKIRLLSSSMAVLVAFALLGLSSSPTYAWTHALNHWDSNHSDFLCGTSSDFPCLYWAQPSNTSITLHAFLDPSLQNAPGSYDFTVAITRAFNDWNSQAAWNPVLAQCNTCLDSVFYTMGTLGFGIYGETDLSDYGTVQFNSADNFWYAPFLEVHVQFSSAVTWNNSLQFSDTTADGRTVSTHETGHLLGLGHTGHSPAIMQNGAINFFSVQADDLNGLQNIYPGFYPGSTQ